MDNREGFVCRHCQRSFHSERALNNHIRDRHERPNSEKAEKEAAINLRATQQREEEIHRISIERKKKTKKTALILVIVFVLAVIIFGVVQLPTISKERKETLRLDGIPSKPIHWHPSLTITINGEKQPIPTDIGILANVHYPIHTHETDGTVHMENDRPNSENVRLAYFFKVWGKTFNDTCIFDACIDEAHELKMYVNGKENTEYGQYVMRDKDEIGIEYNLK